jgi:outer membrane protein assembly factor BamD (BamD/ComL family)
MIAEVFNFRFPRPDSARVHLERIVASPVEDTAYTKRAFYALAWLEREGTPGNPARADSLYRVILARWPGTEWAKQAEVDLGLPSTVKTRGDTAHAAFLAAESHRLGGEAPERVAPAYRAVAESYAGTPDAAKAQFVLATLVADQAHAKAKTNVKPDSTLPDTVKAAYQLVRDKYPETPYATAAEKWINSMDEMINAGEYKEEAPAEGGDDEVLEGDESRKPRTEKLDNRGDEDLY